MSIEPILLTTPRLALRRFDERDLGYILAQLNQPSFIEFIGDKGVRNEADALRYLDQGPQAGYRDYGHGLYAVCLRSQAGEGNTAVEPSRAVEMDTESGPVIGMCGLISRPELDAPDLGFAFLPEYWGQSLAYEAAAALLPWEIQRHNYHRVLAITSRHNQSSGRLLERLGFVYQGERPKDPDGEVLKFFEWRVGCTGSL